MPNAEIQMSKSIVGPVSPALLSRIHVSLNKTSGRTGPTGLKDLSMSKYDEIDELLKKADAFVAGGQGPTMVSAAEAKLSVVFPPSFREYLLRWGNLSFDGYEYYGLTRNSDFENASVPNCVWFTLRKRIQVGLPKSYVVFRNKND